MRLSVGYWRDPKWRGLTLGHEILWIRLLAYTVEHTTDGLIPVHAVSLCGRSVRNRERVVADLVAAGLLEAREADLVHPLCFPSAWAVYQYGTASAKESPGQRPAFGRTQGEERRVYKEEEDGSTLPVRLDIDGVVMEMRDGQWTETDTA